MKLVTARDVAEYVLIQTGDAMMSGDVDAFHKYFQLPLEMDTMQGRRLISDETDFRSTFQAVHDYFQDRGITHMDRQCIEADFQDEKTVISTHETRLISDTTLIQQPFPVFSILKRTDDQWKITFTQYAISDAPELNNALAGLRRSSTSFCLDTQSGVETGPSDHLFLGPRDQN